MAQPAEATDPRTAAPPIKLQPLLDHKPLLGTEALGNEGSERSQVIDMKKVVVNLC